MNWKNIFASILLLFIANISNAARLDSAQSIKFNKDRSLTEVYSLKFKQNLMLKDSHFNRRPDDKIDIKQKSPLLAFIIAAVPGSMIHGLGHYYIGDNKTFKILLITEIISIPIIYVSALADLAEQYEDGRKIPLADVAIFVSLAAFIGTWVYDVVAAPIKANSLIVKWSPRFNISQKVDFKSKIVSMNITYSF